MIDKSIIQATNAWPFVEARKLVKERKKIFEKKKKITLQTGYGPSGLPHIGTFAEVARTTMMVNAIKTFIDIPTEIITFSDDMDGLRKIPDNVPNKDILEKNLHKPLTSVPDPFKKFKSFGEHNNEMLKIFLDKFSFKYNFKTNVTEKTYWKRPDKFQLTKIGKRFKSKDDIIMYFAAHQVAGNKYSGDMIRDEETYTKFLKVIDSMSYVFRNELEQISDVKFDDLLEIEDTYPRIVQLHLEGTVSLETVCIINRLTGFINKANNQITETILWPDLFKKISKYQLPMLRCFLNKK